MKSFKLSLVLLTAVLALQTFTADAFFGNAFAKLAAFSRTQTTAVKSFFNTHGRTFAAKATENKKILGTGLAVTGSVIWLNVLNVKNVWNDVKNLIPTAKACPACWDYDDKELEAKIQTSPDFAFRRYMVAQAENLGVAKQEKCKNIDFQKIKHGIPVRLAMQCPKDNSVLDKLYNAKLTRYTEQQKSLSQLDILNNSGSMSAQKASTDVMLANEMSSAVEKDTTIVLSSDKKTYDMSTWLTPFQYKAIVKELREKEIAK